MTTAILPPPVPVIDGAFGAIEAEPAKRIVKIDANGKIVFIGPDRVRGWRRQDTDDVGNFEIVEDSYVYTDARGERKRGGRPMGCKMPVRRPGRYLSTYDDPPEGSRVIETTTSIRECPWA